MQIDITHARTLTDMSAFLQYLVSIYGAELYKDKQRLYNLIADLYTGEERQKKLFRRAIMEDNMAQRVYELKNKTIDERKALADAIAYRFAENNYFSNEIGQKVTLAFVKGLNLLLEFVWKQRDDGKWEDKYGNIYSKDRRTFEKANAHISKISIWEETTKIDSGAFQNCTSLCSIVLPNSLTEIGREAFSGCTSLLSMAIPNSVTKIGDSAFSGCSSLFSIVIPDSVIEIGKGALGNCQILNEINVAEGNPSFISIDGALYSQDGKILRQCPGSKNDFTIPDSVTEIGDSAFLGCVTLSCITIPDSVIKVGYEAFSGCTSLSSIFLPASTNLAEGAFDFCKALTSITVTRGTGEMGNWSINCRTDYDSLRDERTAQFTSVLSDVSSLETIIILMGVTSISASAFRNCHSLHSIVIPESMTEIGFSAFRGCTSLVSIVIPNSVTLIGEEAFAECSSLSSINIPNRVDQIAEFMLAKCSSLSAINIPENVKKNRYCSLYGLFFFVIN